MTRIPGRRAILLCSVLLLLAAAETSAHARGLAPANGYPPTIAAPAVEGVLEQGDVRSQPMRPAPTTVNSRVLLGVATLIITVVFIPLYLYRRRVFILYWIGGWTLSAASTFLAAHEYSNNQVGWTIYGLSQFVGILGALVFVISADAYRTRPRLRRAYGVVLLPVLIWFGLAPLALGPVAVYVPGHLLMAGGFAAAGLAHAALQRQTRLVGAGIVGTMMLLIAALNGWVAIDAGDPAAAAGEPTTFVSLAVFVATALAMQFMTFEDTTHELKSATRRLESAQQELRQLVTTDPLTSCRNRRFFDEIIGREIQRRRRYDIPLSLLFVDVDRFKAINDTLGHEAGDRVLQRVADFLIRHVREADYVFRWGGDEFLILISCGEEEAAEKGKELQAAFAESSEAGSLPAGVGLSIGCAEVPPDTADIMAVVKTADERMYLDKKR